MKSPANSGYCVAGHPVVCHIVPMLDSMRASTLLRCSKRMSAVVLASDCKAL